MKKTPQQRAFDSAFKTLEKSGAVEITIGAIWDNHVAICHDAGFNDLLRLGLAEMVAAQIRIRIAGRMNGEEKESK